MPSDEFVHVASGPHAAGVVEAALRQLGRTETVVAMGDALEVGPLTDVDAGARLRAEWWRKIVPHPSADELPRELDETPLWGRVRDSGSKVAIWHGPHAAEWLVALRAAWYLREDPSRVFEVALPPPPPSRGLAPFYGAVSLARPTVLAEHWAQRARVEGVAERAARWESLRDRPGEWLRILDGRDVTELPISALDAELEAAAAHGWTSSTRAVGTVLVDHPVGDAFLSWRGRELLRLGRWEGRGDLSRLRLPMEVRTASIR